MKTLIDFGVLLLVLANLHILEGKLTTLRGASRMVHS